MAGNIFNAAELAVLKSAPPEFPMIRAASAALKRCGTCSHGSANVRAMLRAAVLNYASEPGFVAYVKSVTKLPCMIAGKLIEEA